MQGKGSIPVSFIRASKTKQFNRIWLLVCKHQKMSKITKIRNRKQLILWNRRLSKCFVYLQISFMCFQLEFNLRSVTHQWTYQKEQKWLLPGLKLRFLFTSQFLSSFCHLSLKIVSVKQNPELLKLGLSNAITHSVTQIFTMLIMTESVNWLGLFKV